MGVVGFVDPVEGGRSQNPLHPATSEARTSPSAIHFTLFIVTPKSSLFDRHYWRNANRASVRPIKIPTSILVEGHSSKGTARLPVCLVTGICHICAGKTHSSKRRGRETFLFGEGWYKASTVWRIPRSSPSRISLELVWTATGGDTAAEALIHRHAALKACFNRVPVFDRSLTHSPAKQNDLKPSIRQGKSSRPESRSFTWTPIAPISATCSSSACLRCSSTSARCSGYVRRVHAHSAREVDPLRKFVELRFDQLSGTLALHGALQAVTRAPGAGIALRRERKVFIRRVLCL